MCALTIELHFDSKSFPDPYVITIETRRRSLLQYTMRENIVASVVEVVLQTNWGCFPTQIFSEHIHQCCCRKHRPSENLFSRWEEKWTWHQLEEEGRSWVSNFIYVDIFNTIFHTTINCLFKFSFFQIMGIHCMIKKIDLSIKSWSNLVNLVLF